MSSLAEQAWLAEAKGGSVTDFFAEIGVDLGNAAGLEASIRCFANPAAHKHEDRVKSCSVNLGSGLWKCHGCGAQGNAFQAALARGYGELDAMRLARSYGLFIEREKRGKPKLPGERQIRQWVDQMQDSPKVLGRLAELKGWTPQTIRRLQLGWDGERVVFPIRGPKLKVTGVVRYLPGGSPKTLALPGTKRGLFPAPEIVHRRHPLFLVEGEPDAVSLWSAGLPAVGVPGAQSWKLEWASRLAGRRLVVLCDCDEPGRRLAAEIAGTLPKATVVDLEPGRSDGYDVGDIVREAAREGGLWQVREWLGALAA